MIKAGMISADGHVVEPPNCYIDHIDPKYRDNAPRVIEQEDGGAAFFIPGMKKPVGLGLMDGAGFNSVDRAKRVAQFKASDVRPGGYDGKARAEYMDEDGVAAEIIFASVGMPLCLHRDAEYKSACMHAYNRWLEGFCAGLPDRLYGLGQTAVLSIDSAIEDFENSKKAGFAGMMMPGDPVHEDYDHPDYDALWECATSLDLPICFHILTSRAGNLFSQRRGHPMNGFLNIMRAVQDVVGMLVLGGTFERHPKLKMVAAEGDAGWMPHYMYRMDHIARINTLDGVLPGLSKLPSEYVRSNVHMTFQDDWTAFKAIDMLDVRQLLWASDFPHTDSTWPESQSLLAEHAANLTEAQRQAVMRDNTAEVFNLDAGGRSWRMNGAAA